jgi:hypothetical protein
MRWSHRIEEGFRDFRFWIKKILAANTISAEVTPFVVRKKTKNIRQHWRGISSKYRCSKAISELLGVGMKKVRKLGQQ